MPVKTSLTSVQEIDTPAPFLTTGDIKCWGARVNSVMARPSTVIYPPPRHLGAGRTAVDIGVGEHSVCALLDNDDVKCWGRNNFGQLGDGTTTNRTSPPSSAITFPTGRTPVAIADSGAGLYHACALLDDGNVSCWGGNSWGQLGDGTATDRNTPVLTDSLGTGRTAVHVTTGLHHACALLDNGDITCWGHNSDGQLGDGTTTIAHLLRLYPHRIRSIPLELWEAVQVAAQAVA